jgi:hypothetical protein
MKGPSCIGSIATHYVPPEQDAAASAMTEVTAIEPISRGVLDARIRGHDRGG